MVLLKIDCIHRCAHTLNLVPGYYSCTRTKFTLHSSVYTWRTCRGTVPYRYDRSTAVVPRYPTTAVVPRYRTSSRSIRELSLDGCGSVSSPVFDYKCAKTLQYGWCTVTSWGLKYYRLATFRPYRLGSL